jgi:uncharacterized membrane protein YebE (DUF533 family)
MDKTQIILFSAAMAFLAVRLYQKYFKKDKNKTSEGSRPTSGTSFPSSAKDEEYEPYSKK